MTRSTLALATLVVAFMCVALAEPAQTWGQQPTRQLLFLGDRGHHQPRVRFEWLQPVLAQRGLELVYTERVTDLTPEVLNRYAGLILYANIDEIAAEQAQALLDYVAAGHGFIPLHCASYCFRNDERIVALMGAQFQRHGTGVFRAVPSAAGKNHPLMQGYEGFESWDETYVHTRHNERDRVVLEYRVAGEEREPWTWIRTHGEGRVFYTAWGHDERTWSNPGFQNLVERGIRWAVGDDPTAVPASTSRPEMTTRPPDTKPLEYIETPSRIPFYPPGERWGTTADPIARIQKPLPAAESMKHFITPVGFEVRLFASEPQIGKAIAMNWDERGRLWICETVDYPNELQPPGKGRDRIRICEDTDGDGNADKFTVFADQLSIPTAIAFYRGGALVQDGTTTVYLKDTDGDDRADLRKVLISNWALNDTHGGVSNFQYGLDNWYYAMQGYNNSTPVLTDGRRTMSFRQGFFRFRVEGEGDQTAVTELEFLRSTNNNTWGLGFSEDGIVFGSTANGNPSEYLPIPNRYYERVRGWSASVLNGIAESNRFEPVTENVRQVDHHGGFTSAAGHALYTARAWPREYWNRTAFVCEPTGHLIATFVLQPAAAGFRSKNSWNILASHDEWSAPIMAEVGPDGQLWVIDWYNIIVQHNPTPAGYKTGRGNAYEIDLRDKKHGRIYRVVYVGEGASESKAPAGDRSPVDLAGGDTSALVAALKSDNLLWRRNAQRLLVERGQLDRAAQDALWQLALHTAVDDIGLNPAAVHALWTLHGLKLLSEPTDPSHLDRLSELAASHASPGVRRAIVSVLPRAETQFAPLTSDRDPHPQVRLAYFLAVSELDPSPAVARKVAEALSRPENLQDPWLRDAITSAAAAHDQFVLPELIAQPTRTMSDRERDIARRVAEHYARRAPVDQIPELIRQYAANPDSEIAGDMLAGLAAGWPKDRSVDLDAATEASLVTLLDRLPTEGRAHLASLAARWGSSRLRQYVEQIAAALLTKITNDDTSTPDRIAAARQYLDFLRTDLAAATRLLDLISPRTDPELAQGLIEALARSDAPELGATLAERVETFTPHQRAAGLRVLLGRTEWTEDVLAAVEAGTIQFNDFSLDQKQSLASHPNRRLAERARRMLARGGGLPDPDRQKVIDQLSPVVLRPANADQGKEVFKQQCAKCHRHSGEGSQIGPDLTGMAVHPKHELLIHLLDPSRSVEGNFRVYTVVTAEGHVLNGLLASETRTSIELVDAEAKRHVVQREDIDELVASKKSLMPDGFEKQVPPDALANLLEFLTQRGKYLPLPLNRAANVITTKGMFYDESAGAERLVFADWSPQTVDGVPFVLIDPQGDRIPNAIMLYGPQGRFPPRMPRTVSLPCHSPAKAIHLLSGVSGWGFPLGEKGSLTMTVRLHYADGQTEDHELLNGIHFADYIRRVDVPESKLAFMLRSQQLRYLAIHPRRAAEIATIELVKGTDATAPVVMAVTVEGSDG